TLVAGTYDVTVNCLDSFSQDIKGSFTGALIFTSPTQYHSGTGSTASPSASASASTSASASASPSDSASASPSDSASASASGSASASPSASPSSGAGGMPITGSPAALYAVGGILLLGLGIAGVAMAVRRRRDTATKP